MSPASIKNGCVEASLDAGPIGQIGAFLLRVRFGFGRFAHVEDVEVFKDDQPKAIHKRTCRFVLKVLALVFGERKAGVALFPRPMPESEGKTRLGIGEGIIAPLSLETWVARLLAILETAKESSKGFVQPTQDILQHLAVDVLINRKGVLDLSQFCRLGRVAQTLVAHLVEGFALF